MSSAHVLLETSIPMRMSVLRFSSAMDSGSDKYLHKKFKKQLNVADPPKPQYDNNDKEAKATLPSVQEKSASQVSFVECPKTFEDNKDSVPNQSTNRTTSPPYTPSSVYRSSISTVDEDTEPTNPQSTITCISYGSATDHTDTIRPFNFDRKCSVSEPTVDDTRTDQSSILEYPCYVSSKFNPIDKEDISSSNHYEKDHYQEDQPSYLDKSKKPPGEPQENNPLSDKTSGGKHVCPYCNLACSKPSVLQKHIRAHTNERPYPCDSCGFSFKTRSNLYKHCRSRTHANRVMGNKLQEIVTEMEVEHNGPKSPTNQQQEEKVDVAMENLAEKSCQEQKSKPYKPRFHTAKSFFDNVSKENVSDNEKVAAETPNNIKRPNSDLLSIRINEVISKNNSIVNSTDPYLLKRRSIDNSTYQDNNNESSRYIYNAEQKNVDEPLNLTNKNRKRCLSEVITEPAQKSLIKELLLKNLYADTNMQCPYCKMIFQTVTELELHKLRSCKGFTKSSARYNRSSSVNVASILTQNKNAFDSLAYPLKSPGPFLGKTRLVESDKNKSFSFDDNLAQTSLHSLPSTSDLLRTSQRYALSPLTIQTDRDKKPVKLFGGEVKIAYTSGETKSFKIDAKEDQFCGDTNYSGGKLSENRVVKSTLQSGGTVLTNKPAYTKQDSLRNSPDVMRVYENNSSATPKIELGAEKAKFTFDNQAARDMIVEQNKNYHQSPVLLRPVPETSTSVSANTLGTFKYTSIMDFSQRAAKMLTPNLKQLNLTIPGIPVPNKLVIPASTLVADLDSRSYEPKTTTRMEVDEEDVAQNYSQKEADVDRRNLDFAERQILLQQKMSVEPQQQTPTLYNPVNLLVNGKVVRYVPGMPGPVVDAPLDMAYSPSIISTNRAIPPATAMRLQKPNLVLSPLEPIAISPAKKLPVIIENQTTETFHNNLHVDSPFDRQKLSPKTDPQKSPNNNEPPKTEPLAKSPIPKNDSSSPPEMGPPPTTTTEARKFSRPNSLALKPTLASMKTHHGLTPTVFNQILISPDTPRVAKKYNQHMIHGNYFTYLGLKSSTKSVYCTLNKTQPVYVPHFKKLSMYSEWRQQENKSEKFYVSGYDSRQRLRKYTVAGKASSELTVVHSSYKYVVPEPTVAKSEEQKSGSIVGGCENNEEYTYVRGRGRGRFICDQCGIRCTKPSMLKNHILSHSNKRPFTCTHCNFSFKTKGNLTKHMKSKSHTKNYVLRAYSNGSSSSSTHQSESESEMESSDDSTRQQEHEAAYGLLSLSQKTSPGLSPFTQNDFMAATSPCQRNSPTTSLSESTSFIDNEELVHVSKKTFAKNKILDQQSVLNFNAKQLSELTTFSGRDSEDSQTLKCFGRMSASRPLTYPYTSPLSENRPKEVITSGKSELKSIRHFQVIQNYNQELHSPKKVDTRSSISPNYVDIVSPKPVLRSPQVPIVKVNDKMVLNSNSDSAPADLRKRKVSVVENVHKQKIQRNDSEVMDLSVPERRRSPDHPKYNGTNEQSHIYPRNHEAKVTNDVYTNLKKNFEQLTIPNQPRFTENSESVFFPKTVFAPKPVPSDENCVSISYVIEDRLVPAEYDNSAMETLADIATKQVKLEKNSVAKNVATEFLKLATKSEFASEGLPEGGAFVSAGKKVNDMIVKPEQENKSCTICSKSFSKPSQLRLHMNIHYLERPFRCDSCSVGFRTKGQLQKHERSAGHHNKLSSSPALSSSEPRPFKCTDCNIAFRIHGHLAKHLRSKMHIMKLECLAKIPFGLYAELERSNSLLTEINTADGDQCLDSLKALAKKVFLNDPNKLNQYEVTEHDDTDS